MEPPTIQGYSSIHHPGTNKSSGTAIYYKNSLRAEEITANAQDPHHHRVVAAKLGDVIVIEAYAPVSSATEEKRESFFAFLITVI